jgi:hypothetical protein
MTNSIQLKQDEVDVQLFGGLADFEFKGHHVAIAAAIGIGIGAILMYCYFKG